MCHALFYFVLFYFLFAALKVKSGTSLLKLFHGVKTIKRSSLPLSTFHGRHPPTHKKEEKKNVRESCWLRARRHHQSSSGGT